jgi:hypothetical protein
LMQPALADKKKEPTSTPSERYAMGSGRVIIQGMYRFAR